MKTAKFKSLVLTFVLMFVILGVNAQKTKLAILNIDSQGFDLTSQQMGNIVRLEVEKLDTFDVLDRYDVAYLVEKNDLKIDNCFGKICLVETGKIIQCEKMLSGSVEYYSDMIIISLRLINVADGTIEKTQIHEFLYIKAELQTMIKLTIAEMFDRPVDKNVVTALSKKDGFENAINTPDVASLNQSGPRMGATFFTGDVANVLTSSKSQGGYDAFPVMFQFGYQFEIQYLSEGNFQALFEIIPTLTGLDQGFFIPSVTFMNGLRDNAHGWELAFGPNISVVKTASGYWKNNVWNMGSNLPGEDFEIVNRMDSRGTPKLSAGFVIGVGRTFKSGRLNIPLNAYIIPVSSGIRFGISFGYNARKK